MNVLTGQMVMDISGQAFQLDDLRLRMFLNWLTAHCSRMKASIQMNVARFPRSEMKQQFQLALRTWFEPLPVQGILWEYRLILDEIAWWQDLGHDRLVLMTDERQGDDQMVH